MSNITRRLQQLEQQVKALRAYVGMPPEEEFDEPEGEDVDDPGYVVASEDTDTAPPEWRFLTDKYRWSANRRLAKVFGMRSAALEAAKERKPPPGLSKGRVYSADAEFDE